ncbi:MAG TPA: ABC transporter permease [Pyrinomonadaceae bacterium]|nr:ABC transporter permease [Pyrinomonadaceae bacterium]
MGNLLQDVRYGVRMLLKSPGFALVTILALALGIGANSAIFSVVNGVLLRPLPFRTADRLVFMSEWSQQVPNMSVAYPNFEDWRRETRSMEQMAAFRSTGMILTGGSEPERLTGREVSHNFFSVLGTAPALGRSFLPEEDKPGGERAVVLSHGLWQRRFGGDPKIVGQALTLSDESYTVVGVLPQEFEWQAPVDIWVPIGLGAAEMQNRGNHPGIYVLGLLKPGVTVEQARADMREIVGRLAQQYPQEVNPNSFTVNTLQNRATQDIRAALWVLLAAVGFVLLIACANVANLLLARAASRSKEIAIRAAMGAGRMRIVRQLLTESLLLAVAGGALGLLFAAWGLDALLAVIPEEVPRLLVMNVGLDTRVVVFTLGVSVLTGLLFGLAPAVQISKTDLNESLKEGGRTGGTGGKHYVRNALVVAEVALSLLLLVGAGLLVKSFLNLRQSDLGFDPQNVLTARIALPEKRYKENAQIENFYKSLEQRVRALPGVEAAGLTVGLPMNGGIESTVTVEGQEAPAKPEDAPVALSLSVSPGYFGAMKIPVIEGRGFTDQDREGSPHVVVVDEMLAKRFFPNGSAIGRRLRFGGPNAERMHWFEIVGVAKHVKHYGPDEEGRVEVYRPYTQFVVQADHPELRGQPLTYPRGMNIAVRTSGDPSALAPALRNAVLEIDRDQPLAFVQTMDRIVGGTIAPQRFATWMLGLFAASALLLAALGIYGVMAYSVTQRTHEIGLRMALGADRRDVLRMIVGQGMRLTLLGVGIGIVGAFVVMRYGLTSLLFGVEASDPLTYGGVALVLSTVALVSCLLPARRATKVDPMVALRYE